MSVRVLPRVAVAVIAFSIASRLAQGQSCPAQPPPTQGSAGTLNLTAGCITMTGDYNTSHLFGFQLPPNASLTGISGTFSLTTASNWVQGAQGGDPPDALIPAVPFSETLLNINFSTNGLCPDSTSGTGPAWGEAVQYGSSGGTFQSDFIGAFIFKQNSSGTFAHAFNRTFKYPIPITNSTCVFLEFVGTDFEGNTLQTDYAQVSNIVLSYNITPSAGNPPQVFDLSGELSLWPGTADSLTFYAVMPVQAPVAPVQPPPVPPSASQEWPPQDGAQVLDVFGDAASTATGSDVTGTWYFRNITAIYQHNSCARAFPPMKRQYNAFPVSGQDLGFFWQSSISDYRHDLQAANPHDPLARYLASNSQASSPDILILSDDMQRGNGDASTQKVPAEVAALPVALNQGDCLVHVVVPYVPISNAQDPTSFPGPDGASAYSASITPIGGSVDAEFQTDLEFVNTY
jgi:hypothetical protein